MFDVSFNGVTALKEITPDANIDDDQLPSPVRSLLTTEHHSSRGSANGECEAGLDQALARDWWDHVDALSQEHHGWTVVLYPEKPSMARSMAEIFGGIFNLSYRMPGYDGSFTKPFIQAIASDDDNYAIVEADIGACAFVQSSNGTQKARTALIVRCSDTNSPSRGPFSYDTQEIFHLSHSLIAAFQAPGTEAYSMGHTPLYKADVGLPAYGIHSHNDMVWFYRLDDPPVRSPHISSCHCRSSDEGTSKLFTETQVWTYPGIKRNGLKMSDPNDRDAIVKALVSISQEILLDNDEICQQ